MEKSGSNPILLPVLNKNINAKDQLMIAIGDGTNDSWLANNFRIFGDLVVVDLFDNGNHFVEIGMGIDRQIHLSPHIATGLIANDADIAIRNKIQGAIKTNELCGSNPNTRNCSRNTTNLDNVIDVQLIFK